MNNPASRLVVEARSLHKGYGVGSRRVEVLRSVDLAVFSGEMVAVVGPSGVGKSTLLHLVGLLDRPDSGELSLFGEDTAPLAFDARSRWRARRIGFVFQFHALLAEFTLEENVAMPLLIVGIDRAEALARAAVLLEVMGLADRRGHLPDELSGGEQQRGAVARALISAPDLLLADEPTGNLDSANAESLFVLLREAHARHEMASVIVTHNEELAARCDRVLRLGAGGLEEQCSKA